MRLKVLVTVHLVFFIYAKHGHCFSNFAKDKIALEPETLVISDSHLYLPLGWTAQVPCDSAIKLKDINVMEISKTLWKIRYFESGIEIDLEKDNEPLYDLLPQSLNIRNVTRAIDQATIECVIVRPGNTTLISRHRVEIQDCNPQKPEDTNAYNLHDPCAYGKCHVKNDVVQCTCFRQYTGKHCNLRKSMSWFHDVSPYIFPVLIIFVFMISISILSFLTEDRKQEKLMGISQLVGFSDRNSLTLSNLYPFIRKLRRCNFPDPDDDENNDKKYKKLKKKYQRLKAREMAKNGGVTETGTGTGTGTGTTTGTTTGTGTGTGSMHTTNVSGGQNTSARTETSGAFQPVASRRTNKKKKNQKRSRNSSEYSTVSGSTTGGNSNESDGETTGMRM